MRWYLLDPRYHWAGLLLWWWETPVYVYWHRLWHKSPCEDCGWNTDFVEYYTLKEGVWFQATGEPEWWTVYEVEGRVRWLCIGCVESRLDRELTSDDFVGNAPISKPEKTMSPRLRERLVS